MGKPHSWGEKKKIKQFHDIQRHKTVFMRCEKISVTGSSGSGRITIPILEEYFFYVDRTTKSQYKALAIQVNHAEYC